MKITFISPYPDITAFGIRTISSYVKDHGHSIYFSTVFDFGILGLLVLITTVIILARLFLTSIWFQLSYLQIMGVALLGGLINIGTHGLVDFEYNNPLIWIYLGLTFCTINLIRWEGSKNAQAVAS